jgi:hypothetical protein
MRIDLLVPETARWRARLLGQLAAQRVQRHGVASIAGGMPQRKQQFAGIDLIEVVFFKLIGADAAI